MITRFVQSMVYLTALFLLSGGLSYMMALDGAEFREIDRKFVLSTPLFLMSNIVGSFGVMMMYNTHTLYEKGHVDKAVVRLATAIVLITVSILLNHILFTEAMRK